MEFAREFVENLLFVAVSGLLFLRTRWSPGTSSGVATVAIAGMAAGAAADVPRAKGACKQDKCKKDKCKLARRAPRPWLVP